MKLAGELAGIKETDFVVDFGCGDGRVILTLVREFSKCGYTFRIKLTVIRL